MAEACRGHGERDGRDGGFLWVTDGDGEGGEPGLGALVVDREAPPAHLGELSAQLGEIDLGVPGIQRGDLAGRQRDLLFDAADLVSYVSTMVTLHPGDLIATGTTGGVGHARKPPRYLRDGQTIVTRIEGIGELVTPVRRESLP